MASPTASTSRIAVAALAVALCMLGATGAHAGTVYVPFSAETEVAGISLDTEIWLTNTSAARVEVEILFIGLGSNGTKRGGAQAQTIDLRPGTTVVVGGPNNGQVGMMEVTAPDGVAVTARLIGTHPLFGKGLGTEIPVVGSNTLIPGGETAHLQGWERSPDGRVTDLGLVNLSHEASSCRVTVLTAGGKKLANSVLLSLKPLSVSHYADALGLLGETEIANVRAEISCDKPFYTYSLLFNWQTAETLFINPSGVESGLLPPGEEPPAQQCSAGAAYCLQKSGTFFTPTVRDDYRRETLNLPPGSYSMLHFRVEVKHGGWPQPTNGLNIMWWLANSGKHYNLYGFSGLKGPGSNSVLFRHGIGIVADKKPKFSSPFAAVPGETYVFDYVYNAKERFLDYRILDTAGNVLYQVIDRPNVNRVHIENGENITADFSNRLGVNKAEPPSYGWNYKNLLIEVFN